MAVMIWLNILNVCRIIVKNAPKASSYCWPVRSCAPEKVCVEKIWAGDISQPSFLTYRCAKLRHLRVKMWPIGLIIHALLQRLYTRNMLETWQYVGRRWVFAFVFFNKLTLFQLSYGGGVSVAMNSSVGSWAEERYVSDTRPGDRRQADIPACFTPMGMTAVALASTGSYSCYVGCKHKRMRMSDYGIADSAA